MIRIIANPLSGKGNGKKALEAALDVLNEKGAEYSVVLTERKGHAKELAEQASAEGVETIVALGGDGTLHEVLNGIDFSVSRMGIIAAGRGNDFVLGTGAFSPDPRQAMLDIINGEPHDLDYIQVSDKRCINVGGTGLDVDVLLRTANSNNKLTYVASLLRCLLKFKPYHVTIDVEGEKIDLDCIMTGVCNGTQFGAGIKLSPVSIADDGKLDVIIVKKPKGIPTIFVMPGFVKGKHMKKSYVRHIVCEKLHIDTNAPVELDGEIYYDLDFDASVVKGGLKTFARSTEA